MRLFSLWLMLAISVVAADMPTQRIDINNATSAEIEKLPGVGPKLTANIIAGRPYRVMDDLDRVKGIGPKMLEKIRPYVFFAPMRAQAVALAAKPVEAKAKVNINVASQKELEALPEIGPKRAEAIIKARPFKKPDELLKIPGIKRAQMEALRPLITVN
jgi:competence ComEA-like helix-hairpin-helix protein